MSRIENIDTAVQRLTDFIKSYVKNTGLLKIVLGLSGGVDSALSAALAVRAVGKDNVLGLIMPYASSSSESEQHALMVAETLGINTEKIEIAPMVDAYFKGVEVSAVRLGNKCARERMSILFDIAAREEALVQGTSNKTEICLGYATWYGDAACSYNPLGGLYKREVWLMATKLGIPREIIEKKPTADLWPGQTDEGEIGLSYSMADKILYEIVENGKLSLAELRETGAADSEINLAVERINKFAFKRSLPATDLLDGNPVPCELKLRD